MEKIMPSSVQGLGLMVFSGEGEWASEYPKP